jgi:hypothetical protein
MLRNMTVYMTAQTVKSFLLPCNFLGEQFFVVFNHVALACSFGKKVIKALTGLSTLDVARLAMVRMSSGKHFDRGW